MVWTRREFLGAAAGLGAASCSEEAEPTPLDADFLHGVASGDPLADRVILWTRLSGVEEDTEVDWRIGTDPQLRDVVASGTVVARAEADYTVKVDATGLPSGGTYYFRFSVPGVESPTGRTRTLPVGDVERVRFALASCSDLGFGYFNGYAAIAERDDLDAVLHLGDYIYEYANGAYSDGTDTARTPEPDAELVTLEDYRLRYARYRIDPDLQEVHRRHPFIVVWDDHEIANNAHKNGAGNHQPKREGDWETRRDAAVRAYFEWMPIRDDHAPNIWRKFRYGNLVDLLMLDTRLVGRDRQVGKRSMRLSDPERSLLGVEQERWLAAQLDQSAADGVAWRAIGQQVLMGQIYDQDGIVKNTDMWGGYDPARRRALESFARSGDVVVFSGDVHSSWAMDLAADPFDPQAYDPVRGGAAAVEFATPAITSSPPVAPKNAAITEARYLLTHPHIKWVELQARGYVVVDIDAERIEGRWFHLETIRYPSTEERLARVVVTRRGQSRIETV